MKIQKYQVIIIILLIITCLSFLLSKSVNPLIATFCLIMWTITGFLNGKNYERMKTIDRLEKELSNSKNIQVQVSKSDSAIQTQVINNSSNKKEE